MELWVPSRWRGRGRARHAGLRALVWAMAAGGMVATVHAQRKQPGVPDAPLPNRPTIQQRIATGIEARLSNQPVLRADDASFSAADATAADGITLYTVADLALRNSKAVRVAEAEQKHALAVIAETRDVYIPNLAAGSGLGPPSYGFPLGNPTLFNITSNSLVFSFSQHDYIRSARAAWKAATLSLKNVRQQVILDAALNYIDLNKTMGEIAALNQAVDDTDRLLAVMNDRMQAGLETDIQMTRARLTGAQIHLRALQMEDHADDVRQHLAGLTGLSPTDIVPAASSIPPLPDLDFASLIRQQRGENPGVLASAATADARMYNAWGDKRQNYRPTVGFGFQYARFASFTGYTQYYNNFKYNNVEAGIQATWPLFDRTRRDKADESKAAAIQAREQAELDRIQSEEGDLTLWHSLRELEAQEQVANLQQQLAKDMLATTVTQMNQGAANGAPITPQQADQDRIQERTSYVDLEDAQFSVTKVKLDLLNAVGELESWVRQSSQAAGGAASNQTGGR